MTAEQFNIFWSSTYPNTVPISHYFRRDYHDRWFRIHSLPESQRYAENETEVTIILERQNKVITDLCGENSKILLVTGDYNFHGPSEPHICTVEPSYQKFSFIYTDPIDLHQLSPEEYEPEEIFRPAFTEITWNSGQQDNLLMDIANDKLRLFFISIENCVIIAPYDGGVDFVLKDTETNAFYKSKYRNWLSARQDGL
jgi:hypothetical protein